MVFEIQNGNGVFVDITPYIAHGGIKWSRNDVDGPNAGRMQNGYMQRDRIATKYRWDITCRPLSDSEQATLLTLIEPEYIMVRYTDPQTNTVVANYCYSNNFPSTFLIRKDNGEELWSGLAFPVIQA